MKSLTLLINLLGLWVLCHLATPAWAQGVLDSRISFRSTQEPVDQVLAKIEQLGGFSFSYSPDAIDVRRRITITVENQRVAEVLDRIFLQEVQYKVRRRYVILQKKTESVKSKPVDFNYSGYILDGSTGEKLAEASIYESNTLISTISNKFGYYKLRLPLVSSGLQLEIRKEDYIAVSVPIMEKQDTYKSIRLQPDTLKPLIGLPPKLTERNDSLNLKVQVPQYEPVASNTPGQGIEPVIGRTQKMIQNTYRQVQGHFVTVFASAQQHVHTRNIADTLYRPFQASILPFLGTNHRLSGNIVNDFSFNLLAGYSLGVNKLEIGWGINAVRGNVTGFQLAGLSNLVGHDVVGFQYANALNITVGNFNGFQGSNLLNYTGKDFRGFQVAGVGNVIVGNLYGHQISTVYNFANTVRSGRQIGIVNYADSSSTVPIGLFSWVHRNGYRRYEIASDEFNYFNTSFKTGMSRFYNIFTLGFNGLQNDRPLGSIGYGVGTARLFGRGWGVNLDFTGNLVWLADPLYLDSFGGLFRAQLGLEKRLGKRLALSAGPSINIFVSDHAGIFSESMKGVRPIWLGGKPGDGSHEQSWLGFVAALRFCNPR
ncbi:STN and carboxypeptidase regulatory-like domain-containing protein [Dyadobacter tibetensis]|uniref:STN and carboxypeptidase regulatory-like domain-containing protein n=1 Tax=Dyadobacter tibetensis TaxID=1211851 RepID=UPI000472A28B|nr:STN and carboxypeptidase regulatory-like domain-containing protein [Dyadobacter tibetensis]